MCAIPGHDARRVGQVRHGRDTAAGTGWMAVVVGIDTPSLPGCQHDTVWYTGTLANALARQLSKTSTDHQPDALPDDVAEAIRTTAFQHDGEGCAVADADHPCAAVGIFRWTPTEVDYYLLGPVTVLVTRHGKTTPCTDNRSGRAPHRRQLSDRTRRNHAQGYWCAAAIPGAAYHAVRGRLPRAGLTWVGAMDDGAMSLVTKHRKLTADELLDELARAGVEYLVQRTREAETAATTEGPPDHAAITLAVATLADPTLQPAPATARQRAARHHAAAIASARLLPEIHTRNEKSMLDTTLDAPFLQLFDAERRARNVARLHSLHVPGPWQCQELTKALYEADQREREEAGEDGELPWTVEEAVARQAQRRETLLSDSLLGTAILLDEHLLRRRISAVHGAAVARAELAYLRAAATGTADWCDDRSVVLILPETCPVVVPADFTIVQFSPDAGADDFVYREDDDGEHGAADPRYKTAPAALAAAHAKWNRLRALAVDDTVRVLDDMDAQLR